MQGFNFTFNKDAPSANASQMLAVLLLYAIGRFIYHPALYFFLFLFFILFLKIFLQNKESKKTEIFLFLPLVLLSFIASIGAYAESFTDVGTYYFFSALIFFFLAASPRLFPVLHPSTTRHLGVFFTLLVIPFLLYPDLKNYGTYQVSLDEIQSSAYHVVEAYRPQVFFYHSNEFAVFSSALFIIQMIGFAPGVPLSPRRIVDSGLLASTLLFIIVTHSVTALVVVLFTVGYRWGFKKILDLGAYLLFFTQTITQLLYPRFVSDMLSTGSFYWRYNVAERVTQIKTEAFDFTPFFMRQMGLETWPHSFILDYVLCYGFLMGFVPLILISLMALSPRTRPFVGWFCVFFAAAAVQPIGAMPVPYLALAVSIGALLANHKKQQAEIIKPQPKILHPSLIHGVAVIFIMMSGPAVAQTTPVFIAKQWFALNSPWFLPIGAGERNATFGDAAIAAFRARGGSVTLNVDLWTTTVLTADAATPRFDINWGPWHIPQVPVPPALFPALEYLTAHHDTDRNFCIIDNARQKLYTFWAVDPDPVHKGSIAVKAGGIFAQGDAGWNDNTKGPWSGRASGASTCGGLITPEEMQAGTIPHALAAGWPHDLIRSDKSPGAVVFPATTTDGGNDKPDAALPMGTRLQLDPTLNDQDLIKLGLQNGDLIIAHAIQKYGVYIVDSSSTFSITFVSGLGRGRDIYPNVTGSWPPALMAYIHATTPPARATAAPLDNWQGEKE